MQRNVGGYHCLGRFAFGPPLLVAGVVLLSGVVGLGAGPLGVAVGALAAAVGAAFLLTGWLQWCPINALAEFDTTDGGR